MKLGTHGISLMILGFILTFIFVSSELFIIVGYVSPVVLKYVINNFLWDFSAKSIYNYYTVAITVQFFIIAAAAMIFIYTTKFTFFIASKFLSVIK